MKNTGITRPIDELGRVVIPRELRSQFDLQPKDIVEIYTVEDAIVFKKYQPGCILCGEFEGIKVINGKRICGKCRQIIREEG